MSKPIRIYHRPNRLKRGYKLGEVPSDSTFQECLTWIRENVSFKFDPYYMRFHQKNGEVVVDYGSHTSNIIIHSEFEELKQN